MPYSHESEDVLPAQRLRTLSADPPRLPPSVLLALLAGVALGAAVATGAVAVEPRVAGALGLSPKDGARNAVMRKADAAPAGAVALFGDSIAHGLAEFEVSPVAVNFGLGGDTVAGVTGRLRAASADDSASAVVVHVGTNDLARRGADEVAREWASLLDAVPAGVPVVASAVLPVDSDARGPEGGRNGRAAAFNELARAACERRPGCTFVPSPFSAPLSRRFHVGDGLHLNRAGSARLARALAEAVEAGTS